jgi:hypothetical protein
MLICDVGVGVGVSLSTVCFLYVDVEQATVLFSLLLWLNLNLNSAQRNTQLGSDLAVVCVCELPINRSGWSPRTPLSFLSSMA